MQKFKLLILLIFLMSGRIGAAPAPASPAQILACMHANLPESLRAQDVALTSFDRAGGSHTLRGTLYARRSGGLVQAMLALREPADLAGSSYLAREVAGGGQEIYMYLPALGKVRRIRAQNIDTSLLGTDLNYDDLKQLANAFAGAQPSLEAAESVEGRAVDVLSAASPPGETARFDRVRAWVDRDSCVALRVVFYRGTQPLREFRVSPAALERSGSLWFASRASMTDLETQTHTEFSVLGLHNGAKVSDRVFDPHLFYIGGD